ncbi:dual oxidase 2 [Engraulis encrasicolus]|uniref:dual oxidase 2 n=1 Tax=Engraulis encrasicolus TaxID=184585 RepID=UPI002FD36FC9
MDLRTRVWSTVFLLAATTVSCSSKSNVSWEVQRYDGWYNNLAYHSRGSAGQPLARLLPARYADGVYAPLEEPKVPNPRAVSNVVARGPSGLPSSRNQTVLSLFFGYHVLSDVLEVRRPGCPPEFMHISIPEGDPVFHWNAAPAPLLRFQRGQWDPDTGKSPNNPRTQVNQVSSWIDGSSVYGSSSSVSDALRSFTGGLLASGAEPRLPRQSGGKNLMWSAPDPSTNKIGSAGLYELGNAWANENPFTLAEGVVWFRYHNYLASKLHRRHPDWSDDQLFHAARKRLVATLQNIAVYEWLPSYLGKPLPPYTGYQKHVDPAVSPEFAAAAIRFGLSMMPSGVYMRNRSCHYRQVSNGDGSSSPARRLCNSFWSRNNPNLQTAEDVDELILGMTSQIAEREDNIVVEDLRDYMYGTLKFSRSDAVAMTIQRGRDFGLPSYREVRQALSLPLLDTWADLNPQLNHTHPQLFQDLSALYGHDFSRLELFPGGLLESVGTPGPVFSALVADQFQRIRNGDRFWFENTQNGLFTEEEIMSIRQTSYHDIIIAVTTAQKGDIQKNVFFWKNGDPCPQPGQLLSSSLSPCTPPSSTDFFTGASKAGFAILIIVVFLFPVVSLLVAAGVAFFRSYRFKKLQKRSRAAVKEDGRPAAGVTAYEWQGAGEESRAVLVELKEKLLLEVRDPTGVLLRSLSLGAQSHLTVLLSSDRKQNTMLLKVPKEYDLVLMFEGEAQREEFVVHLKATVEKMEGGEEERVSVRRCREKEVLKEAVSRSQRQQIVETFIRHAFAQVLDIERRDAGSLAGVSSRKTREALQCELSGEEFASALGLKPDSLFVQSMFTLADKDGNGYLSMQEFLDVIAIFMKGSPEEKSRLLFSMHDIDRDGCLSKEEFSTLLRSFIEISSSCLSKSQAQQVIQAMLQAAGFHDDKETITWDDFHLLLRDHEDELQFAQLNIQGMEMEGKNRMNRQHRVSFISPQRSRSQAHAPQSGAAGDGVELRKRQLKKSDPGSGRLYVNPQPERYRGGRVRQHVQQFKRLVENYRRHIVCFCIIFGITAGVALERCWYYSLQAVSSGVPEVSAVGVVVSRGSAAAISFLFPYMLLTVCRNLITRCRETFLNRYVPFDAAIDFHRVMAMTAIVLTAVHSLGHVVNLYALAVSELSILACLFPAVLSNNGSEMPLPWTFWFFQTIPGVTGLLLLLVLSFIYVFASRYFRRVSFRAFWLTHYLYSTVYILTVIHGSFGLLQQPRFFIYLIPPGLLFLLDKLISLSRKKVEIPVLRAELLPSGVTYLEFKRPVGFAYRSGQWVRVACLALGSDEYHPFTLTSAPHQETLSLHIRAVGPWTSQLRDCYHPDRTGHHAGGLPKLYLDGPFGEGHQEWTDFEVSVLVGAGIGVTPFASILKDLVFKSSVKSKVQCKKIYFIWVTRTQRQFEWVSDIIREVEEADAQDLVSVHIYITQLAHKFDLRTTMLYVCERHFQKVWNRSVFTGLRSVTHFGRPPFSAFFSSLQEVHPEVKKIGVFSCGPPGLTKNVEKACQQMNKRDQAHFMHHYENF